MKFLLMIMAVILYFVSVQIIFAGEWKQTIKLNTLNGKTIEKVFYEGKRLSLNNDGVNKIVEIYGSGSLITERSYFGKNKKPIINKSLGISKEIYRYNNGTIKVDYFGVKGEKLMNSDGCYNVWYLTENSNIIAKNCYPSLTNPRGIGTYWNDILSENSSNSQNLGIKCIKQSSRGIDGKPSKDRNGFYGYQICYNTNNQMADFYFFSNIKADGWETYGLNEDGVAWYNYFYKDNMLIARHNYGSDLQPTEDKNGYQGYTSTIGDKSSDLWIHLIQYIGKDLNKKNDKLGIAQYFFRFKGSAFNGVKCKDYSGVDISCPVSNTNEGFLVNFIGALDNRNDLTKYINRPTLEQFSISNTK